MAVNLRCLVGAEVFCASDLRADPALLVSAIGYHRCGHPRSHIRSPDLEREIWTGAIVVLDFVAEVGPPPADELGVLRSVACQTQKEPHWRLKRCAWIVAAAMMPGCELRPESMIDSVRRKKVADLIAVDETSGRSVVFEVGAVSCDSILVALDAGHHQVVVLPHQPDDNFPVRGFVFARTGTDPLPPPAAVEVRQVEAALRGRLAALTSALRLAPADIGLATWFDDDPGVLPEVLSTYPHGARNVHS